MNSTSFKIGFRVIHGLKCSTDMRGNVFHKTFCWTFELSTCAVGISPSTRTKGREMRCTLATPWIVKPCRRLLIAIARSSTYFGKSVDFRFHRDLLCLRNAGLDYKGVVEFVEWKFIHLNGDGVDIFSSIVKKMDHGWPAIGLSHGYAADNKWLKWTAVWQSVSIFQQTEKEDIGLTYSNLLQWENCGTPMTP